MFIIAPSILSADFANLGKEITDVIHAGANWIHFDVMDNHYVPNLTLGPMVCKAIKPYTKNIPIDVHLMVEPVDNMINSFAKAGADIVTFHAEASRHIDRSLSLIKSHNIKSGIVLNPATPVEILNHILDKLDVILIMSVNPGFGGQDFIPSTLDKIKKVRGICDEYFMEKNRKIIIEVDGGIKINNILDIAKSGADAFVAGSAIFNQKDYKSVINEFLNELNKFYDK